MTPTFFDFFKSFYYSNTFVPPVDLSFRGTRKHLLERAGGYEVATTKEIAKEVFDPIIQSILSEPLNYDLKSVTVKNNYLKSRGFKLLSQKSGREHYSVVEHPKLKGWVIKAGAPPNSKHGAYNDRSEMTQSSEEGNLLRIAMAERVLAVAEASGIDVVVPMKKLFEYEQPNGTKTTDKYCVFSEKIEILSEAETIERIKKMDESQQRKLAQDLSTIIQKAGLVDNGFHNIRLTLDEKLAFIDTEPVGLLIAQEPGFWSQLFPSRGTSVEQCGRIGLFQLLQSTSAQKQPTIVPVECQTAAPGLEHFYGQILHDYGKTLHPELSASKIALSIVTVGLLPLFVLIVSIINSISAYFLYQKICQREVDLHSLKTDLWSPVYLNSQEARSNNVDSDDEGEEIPANYIFREDFKAEFEQENERLRRQFYALTKAVPFKTPPGPALKPQAAPIPVVDFNGEFFKKLDENKKKNAKRDDCFEETNNTNVATSAPVSAHDDAEADLAKFYDEAFLQNLSTEKTIKPDNPEMEPALPKETTDKVEKKHCEGLLKKVNQGDKDAARHRYVKNPDGGFSLDRWIPEFMKSRADPYKDLPPSLQRVSALVLKDTKKHAIFDFSRPAHKVQRPKRGRSLKVSPHVRQRSDSTN